MGTKTQLSSREFDRLVDYIREQRRFRLHDTTLEIARAMLVERRPVAELRDEYEADPTWLYRVRRRFMSAWTDMRGETPAAIKVTVEVPPGTKSAVQTYARLLWQESESA